MSEESDLVRQNGSTLKILRDPKYDDPEFQSACKEFVREADAGALKIDLRNVKFLTSREIGVLVHTKKLAREEGKKLDFDVSNSVRGIIKILNLDDYLGINGEDGTPSGDNPVSN